ncbi:hypothetical protein F5Y08DRAFT_303508 [Xylaria arbuscula]|nr:hypothetical protein F5Y08DRAFT_303508 [Xylaria arbuscula]
MAQYRDLRAKAPLPSIQSTPQKQCRNRHTGAEWESQRESILQLYMHHSAQEVVNILATDYNFSTGLRMLRTKLNEWGAPNKNLSHEDMKYVQKKRRKLQKEGRETQFYHHGQPLTNERLDRFDQRFSKGVEAASPPSAGTPDAITYDTPKPTHQALSATAQTEDCQIQRLECPTTGITLVFAYTRATEPDSRTITHKHQMGKLVMQFSGLSLEPSDQGRLLLQGYHTAAEIRKRAFVQEEGTKLATGSLTLERYVDTTCFWVTYPKESCFNQDTKNTIVYHVQHTKFLHSVLSLLSPGADNWTENWFQVEDREGANLKSIIEREMGSNATFYPSLTFLDVYIRIATSVPDPPIIAKISLGVDIQSRPPCSICETDILTIQCFSTGRALSMTIPLVRTPGPNFPMIGNVWVKSSNGGWKAAAASSAGFDLLAPCMKCTSTEEQYKVCLARYEVECDRGEWDPLANSEYQESFQPFPLEREHICCNRRSLKDLKIKDTDEKEFDAYQNHGIEFMMSPDDGESWNP